MTTHLDQRDADFETRFAGLLSAKRESLVDVAASVAEIIADVRTRGDDALADYSRRFDRVDLAGGPIAFTAEEIDRAVDAVDAETIRALTLARDRIAAHHGRQMPTNDRYTDSAGIELGSRWTAVGSVGLYVPGGLASYPSSVLMNAVPALVAGVERIAMVVPTPDGRINPLVLAAARLASVSEVYRVGGAQAVAALAYGTRSIAPVDKIVGPGNAYVAEAKRQVFGAVGIDMIAGPSEILVLADDNNDPDWIAVDLLAQAEHDTAAQSILITDSPAFAEAVAAAVTRQLADLPRAEIAGTSWRDFGAIIRVPDFEAAVPLVDRLAPEHLELAIDDAEAILARIRNAGAVFVGRYTPEAIGDYVGGTNHVLPTARSARFSSGLSVLDFMKRTSILKCDANGLARIGPAGMRLAAAEGLDAHGRSIAMRLGASSRAPAPKG